jgi:outer membrane lipoprotein SlyB
MKKLAIAFTLAATGLALTAQAEGNPHGLPPGIAKKMHACEDCGYVQSVSKIKRKGEGGAAGIVGGAVVGGLVGHQFGKGNGNTLATVGGAVAGGFAGNEVQKQVTSKEIWVTKVQLKDGSVRSFEQEAAPAWKSGELVRVHKDKVTSL